MKGVWIAVVATLAAAAGAAPVMAQAAAAEVVVVMDDLGYSLERGRRVLALPVPVTLALLPHAPATAEIARQARHSGHELILHQPMEPLPRPDDGRHIYGVVPGTLTIDMSEARFHAELASALNAVPGIVGVNNHTGSALTQDAGAMRRLMGYLSQRNLMFLDSRTTAATVAFAVARETHVPAVKRDVFLDHVPTRAAIAAEFARALVIARRQGFAVIIAHPYDVSLEFLDEALAQLPPGYSVTTLRRLAERTRPATLARHESPAFPHRSLGR